jgi:Flp pilus assembly CpaF family ATPase
LDGNAAISRQVKQSHPIVEAQPRFGLRLNIFSVPVISRRPAIHLSIGILSFLMPES